MQHQQQQKQLQKRQSEAYRDWSDGADAHKQMARSASRDSQSYKVQFKSLGSIEEESPRWVNPPRPEAQDNSTSSRGLLGMVHGSDVMMQLLGHNSSQQSEVNSNQNDHFRGDKVEMITQLMKHPKFFERHVQSQPALQTTKVATVESNKLRQPEILEQFLANQNFSKRQQDQGQDNNIQFQQRQGSSQSREQQRSASGDEKRQRYPPVAAMQQRLAQDQFKMSDSQIHPFSARMSKASFVFETFVDRLNTREKAAQVLEELDHVSRMLLVQVAKETPEIHSAIQEQLNGGGFTTLSSRQSSHYATLDATVSQAQNLRASFAHFLTTRNEVHSFGQIVEGIKMDVDEAIGERFRSLEKSNGSLPGINDGTKVSGNSSINNIKSGDLQTLNTQQDQQRTLPMSKDGDFYANQCSNENMMVQIMRQQESEISECNKLIEKLKNECADLELTIVDQRSEIQNLCNRLKQQHSPERSNASGSSFDRREMESFVQRLKEELRRSQDEGHQAKSHLKDSVDVIKNLQTQISSLKHKLVLSESSTKNIHNTELEASLKELADARATNLEIQRRFDEMAAQCKFKEKELLEMEEKSRQMLIAAQKDAHDCIKYFKGLAIQQLNGSNQSARSHSPISNRRQKELQADTVRSAFPTSLAPVAKTGNSGRNKEKSKRGFRGSDKSYVVNGVTLKVSGRQSFERRENSANTLSARQRAQTLSPMPSTSRRENKNFITVGGRSTMNLDDSSLSERSLDRHRDEGQRFSGAQYHYQLELALNQLVGTFQEVAATKTQMNEIMQSVNEQYCGQLEKFSVLAYDYLERISNVGQREITMREEFTKQSTLVNKLREICEWQRDHIQAQNALISEQTKQLSLQKLTKESHSCEAASAVRQLGSSIKEQFPRLRDTITASHVALLQSKKRGEGTQNEFKNLTNAHDLVKKKVAILEEELEKSLQTSQMLEETVQTNRKKFNQLVDLIKDIWQEHVQSAGGAPQNTTITLSAAPTVGNHGMKNPAGAGETTSELNQTIQTTVAPDVPMPVSWLSDIADHIKTLKEMNDLQTEEVFQIVGLLHSKGDNKDSASAISGADKLCESNTSDEEGDRVTQSGLSQQAFGNQHHQQQQNEFGNGRASPSIYDDQNGVANHYNPYQVDDQDEQEQDEVDETETERDLEHYNEVALNGGLATVNDTIDEQEQKYIITTSENVSKQKQSGAFQMISQSQDKKEMSFSQRLEDSQEVNFNKRRSTTHHHGGKRGKSQTHTGRRMTNPHQNVVNARDRSHPSRNLDWIEGNLINKTQRVVETQRVEKHRRSLNITSNRWKEALYSDNDRSGDRRQRHTIVHTTSAHNGGGGGVGGQQNYRASINMMTETQPLMVGDQSKRNELYQMLREEVLVGLKQAEVSKNTIVEMKRQLRQKRQEIDSNGQAFQLLNEEKDSLVEINNNLEGEIKDLENQIDELQGIVHDRETSMDSLKMQIEDFEKELMGLQDQMTHVMRLNQEIGLASEHWESSFIALKDQSTKEQAKMKADLSKKITRKTQKLQLLKSKLAEKEDSIKNLSKELATEVTNRTQTERKRLTMPAIETQTEPAMELLEQHKDMLETKLEQVRCDVAAVLDQVEKEQQQNRTLEKRLTETKDANKSLNTELDVCKSKLREQTREVEVLQKKLDDRMEEIKQMSEAMEQDQVHFREQMEHYEQVNNDLQQQVEEVTRAAEDLQDQMNNSYQNNDSLVHNAEIQEQKINTLEDQLVYYQNQLKQKKATIERLEAKLNRKEPVVFTTSKRETRSVSVPRIHSKNSTQGIIHNPFTSHLNTDYSKHIVNKEGRNSRQSSLSKQSSSMIGGGGVIEDGHDHQHQKAPHRFMIANDDMNNSLATSQSIFDETPNIQSPMMEESGTFHQRQINQQNSSHLQKPPRNQRTQKTRGSSPPSASPMMLGKTTPHAGSSIMGTSQNPTCCCGSTNCMNSTSQLPRAKQSDYHEQQSTKRANVKQQQASRSKMTAIDDLQSSYANFRQKQEAGKESKKKLKKVLHMTEVLVRHYLSEAQLRMDSFNKQFGTTKDSGPMVGNGGEKRSSESTLTNLKRHVSNWSNQDSSHGRPVSESQAKEAQEYFQRRNPKVINCLMSILNHVGLGGAGGIGLSEYTSQDITNQVSNSHANIMGVNQTTTKDPPLVVSGRNSAQCDTEQSSQHDRSSQKQQQDNDDNTDRVYGTVPNDTGDVVNLLIREEEYPSNLVGGFQPYRDLNSERTLQQQQTYTTQQMMSIKSPTSSCRNCTATFNQTQSMTNDLVSHCKLLFQKFLQTGRSLAGVCYGGCLFMGDQLRPRQRDQVDFALQFLAKDSSDFEGTNGQSLDELWGVVDGLLTCLSQIISQTCQSQLRGDNKMQAQQAFDSIVQKSIELSIDQNHMISRMERASFDDGQSARKTLDFQAPPSQVHGSHTSQVNVKLADLEQRIKHKLGNIKQLEGLLDSILGKQSAALLPQICNDLSSLQKVFMNVRRAVSKLKIELHQDYLFLGQVNLHFQTSREQHNSSMQTTFDVPNMQTQNSMPGTSGSYSGAGAGAGHGGPTLHNRNMTAQASMPLVGQPMQIGSGIVSSNGGGGPITAREPATSSTITMNQGGNGGGGFSLGSHPYLSPHQQQNNISGLNLRSQVSIGNKSSISNGTSPVPGRGNFHSNAGMSSARFSSNSQATNTGRQPPNSNIDKIVEELQSLTFEYSNGTTVNRTMTQGNISANYSNNTPYQQPQQQTHLQQQQNY